jgi:hypothetical protein
MWWDEATPRMDIASFVGKLLEQDDVDALHEGVRVLAFCPACCLVYNIAFAESLIDYDVDYDNTLHHSRTFQVYASDLAQRLARDYDLDGRQVVELGCDKGHFLVELSRAAGCRGIGFDRSYAGDVEDPAVTFVRDCMPCTGMGLHREREILTAFP